MKSRLRMWSAGLLSAALAFGTVPAGALAGQEVGVRAQAASLGTISWERLGGDTRYDTMQLVVGRSFAASNYAVVASGENYPDALSASALAGALSAPVIITEGAHLTPATQSELVRLNVTRAYIVGGPQAVSQATEDAIRGLGISVSRIAGEDRQATSQAVAAELLSLIGDGYATLKSDTAFVCSGTDFVGALSISPWAYRYGAPILLADASGLLSAEAVKTLVGNAYISRIVLVGDTVSEAVMSQLSLAGKTCSVERIFGSETHALNLAATEWELENGFAYTRPVVACGSKYPDALCGAALAAQNASPLIMVDDLSDATWKQLESTYPEVLSAFALGGFAATPLVWSANPELNQVIDELFSSQVNIFSASALEEAYEYVSGYDYETGPVYPEGDWRVWSAERAVSLYRTGAGNCYDYASLFCWAARRLGYDARVVSGMTQSSSQGLVPHSWAEVVIDGVPYVVDPERHHNYLDRDDLDFFLVTYEQAPMYYYDLAGNEYA